MTSQILRWIIAIEMATQQVPEIDIRHDGREAACTIVIEER